MLHDTSPSSFRTSVVWYESFSAASKSEIENGDKGKKNSNNFWGGFELVGRRHFDGCPLFVAVMQSGV